MSVPNLNKFQMSAVGFDMYAIRVVVFVLFVFLSCFALLNTGEQTVVKIKPRRNKSPASTQPDPAAHHQHSTSAQCSGSPSFTVSVCNLPSIPTEVLRNWPTTTNHYCLPGITEIWLLFRRHRRAIRRATAKPFRPSEIFFDKHLARGVHEIREFASIQSHLEFE